MSRRAWHARLLWVLVASCGAAPVAADETPPRYSDAKLTGWIRDPRVREISGIVHAAGKPGYFWVHNDSGGGPYLYLVHLRGSVVTRLRITGATGRDWEDIAIGPGPQAARAHIYIADTGNNARSRDTLSIDRVLHPKLTKDSPPREMRSERAERIAFRYPDGKFDCEAMVVHPTSGDIYLLTKNALAAGIYRLRSPRADGSVMTAEKLTVLRTGLFVTGADVSPEGDRLLIRTYTAALEFSLPAGKPFERIFFQPRRKLPIAPREKQSEAIAYVHGGEGYVTSDEGSPAPLHVFMRMKE